jgi:hypothetical protein
LPVEVAVATGERALDAAGWTSIVRSNEEAADGGDARNHTL